MALSYSPYDMRMQSDNYLTNYRNGQADIAEQTYLDEEQKRLQNQIMRQRLQQQFDAQNGGPSYASGGGRGGSGASMGGDGDVDSLPQITSPQYLPYDQEKPASAVQNATPDSLRGSNTIMMSIAPTSAELANAPTYSRTLNQNPAYEKERSARAGAIEDRMRIEKPGLEMTRLANQGRADTTRQTVLGKIWTAAIGAKSRAFDAEALAAIDDSVNRALRAAGVTGGGVPMANQSGGGVGGGNAPAPHDVSVDVAPGGGSFGNHKIGEVLNSDGWVLVDFDPSTGRGEAELNGKRRPIELMR